jgi:hypothetical protein
MFFVSSTDEMERLIAAVFDSTKQYQAEHAPNGVARSGTLKVCTTLSLRSKPRPGLKRSELGLIRSRRHLLRGGYDAEHGRGQEAEAVA